MSRPLSPLVLACALIPWAGVQAGEDNLLVKEKGVTIIGHSSSYGGWDVTNMVPSLARLSEPGVTIEGFVWCTADDAPFPYWVLFELKEPQWLTTFVFNNALKEEPPYPGISARQVEARRPAQRIAIEGHTDSIGGADADLALSRRRAQAMADELMRLGAQASSFETVGYGTAQPVARNDSDAGRTKDRRVTVRLRQSK